MRKRLVVAGVALLLVVAVVVLVSAAVLRNRAEETWRATLDQLQLALGRGASVSYGSLDVALFARGGTVRALSISAPGLQSPFALTIAELRADGLVQEGADGLRIDSGEARAIDLVTTQGRWQLDRAELDGLVVDDSTISGPQAWTRRVQFEAGRLEQLSFDRTRVLPAAPPVFRHSPGGGTPGSAENRVDDPARHPEAPVPEPPAAQPSTPEPAAGPKPSPGAKLAGSLARAELGRLDDGRLSSLRFERLLLDAGEARALRVARGGLDGLDFALLASGLAGRLLPAHPLFERVRLEGGEVGGQGSALDFASLVAEQGPVAESVRTELTVEGLKTRADDPRLGAYWSPIETAGYGSGFRLHALVLAEVEGGGLRLRDLKLELPQAASLTLSADLRGLDLTALASDPERAPELGLRGRLASAELVLIDEGGLDAILSGVAEAQGMTARQLRQVAAFQVAEALRQGQLPRALGLAVQEFLAEPGRLDVRLDPAEPVPLVALALAGLAPERAAEQFGITAQSGPAR